MQEINDTLRSLYTSKAIALKISNVTYFAALLFDRVDITKI